MGSSPLFEAVVGLREHFRGGRSTPTRGGAPDREGAPLDAADAEVATIAAFRSEAAAARDDMLDGLSRLRRDLEVHRRGAEPPQPEAAMPRLEAAVAAAQLRRARSPERWQPHAADGAPAPSASGGSEGPSFEVEIAQLRASLSLLGARVAALERSSERMLLAGAQGGDIDATLRDPLATHVVFGAGEHALARAEGAGSVVSRGELCALIADEVRSHTERVAGHLRADAMAHNVELRADFARRLEVVEEELHSAAARRPHGVDAAASLQPQRQHGAGGADEPWSARAAEERRAQLGEDPLISWDLKLSLERLVERVSETAGGTPTVAPAVATPSASTPCATGHGELGGSFRGHRRASRRRRAAHRPPPACKPRRSSAAARLRRWACRSQAPCVPGPSCRGPRSRRTPAPRPPRRCPSR
ncbi:unnamed protein product [Prorocentrum cordatum]|uniref:Uncharacterized protein n=1 Tax=Prorocentrum cordatum TaxID=2364126 RepID=A0ABN9XUJ1_9DINO|nr:unnamed protein product [Polarella glacialis]